jgi:O-acetyl-ADP-ribose deacetylase (regulator of RNase III)
MKIEIKKVKGNIIDMVERGEITATAHGCNCFHTMGSGIAKTFNEYTEGQLLEADKRTVYGDINKLGDISYIDFNNVKFFNIYSQFVYASQVENNSENMVYVHWESVYKALYKIIFNLPHNSDNILALPYIGCGLAGGKEEDLENLIDKIKNSSSFMGLNMNLTILIVEFQP